MIRGNSMSVSDIKHVYSGINISITEKPNCLTIWSQKELAINIVDEEDAIALIKYSNDFIKERRNAFLHPSWYTVEEGGTWIKWPSARLVVTKVYLDSEVGNKHALTGLIDEGLTLKFYSLKIGEKYWNVKTGWRDKE